MSPFRFHRRRAIFLSAMCFLRYELTGEAAEQRELKAGTKSFVQRLVSSFSDAELFNIMRVGWAEQLEFR